MMHDVKPPYGVAAILSNRVSSKDELVIMSAVDTFMRVIRAQELINPSLDPAERNELIKKHVDAAHEYYGNFSSEDLAKMLLVDKLLEKEGGENDERSS